jgi:hypothetical protein
VYDEPLTDEESFEDWPNSPPRFKSIQFESSVEIRRTLVLEEDESYQEEEEVSLSHIRTDRQDDIILDHHQRIVNGLIQKGMNIFIDGVASQ